MCECRFCTILDNVCCPLRLKAICFGIWTLLHGIVCSLVFAFCYEEFAALRAKLLSFLVNQLDRTALIAFAVVHCVCGIILLVGVLKRILWVIYIGIILSFIACMNIFCLIYPIIMQILFSIWTYRYCRLIYERRE